MTENQFFFKIRMKENLSHSCHRLGNGQGKKSSRSGKSQPREFYFESGKIGILEKSLGKLKQFNMADSTETFFENVLVLMSGWKGQL